MATVTYHVSTSGYAQNGRPWHTSTGTIIQGTGPSGANYYGVAFFDFAAIRAYNAANRPTSITVRLPSNVAYARTVRLYVGSGMQKDTWTSGSRPTAVTGYKEVAVAANGTAVWTITDQTWLDAIVGSSATCLYINRGDSSGSYFEGRGSAMTLEINWETRISAPSSFTLPVAQAVKGSTVTATIGKPAQIPPGVSSLTYRVLVNGAQVASVTASTSAATVTASWTVTQAPGATYTVNAVAVAGSAVSGVSVGRLLAVIAMSAPTVTRPSASAYSGQTVTITVGRPTYAAPGSLTYKIYYNGSQIGTVSGSASSLTYSWTIPAQSANVAGNLTATAEDSGGNVSPSSTPVLFTLNRYSAPVIAIKSYSRPQDQIEIALKCSDTGYGGTQSAAQLAASVTVSVSGGAYGTITQTAWSNSLQKTITISGVDDNTRYSVSITATNVAPSGSGLSAKTGSTSKDITESVPAAFVFHDTSANVEGIQAQGLIVGPDLNQDGVPGGTILYMPRIREAAAADAKTAIDGLTSGMGLLSRLFFSIESNGLFGSSATFFCTLDKNINGYYVVRGQSYDSIRPGFSMYQFNGVWSDPIFDAHLAYRTARATVSAASSADTDVLTISLPKGYKHILIGHIQINAANPNAQLHASFNGATFNVISRATAGAGGGVVTWAFADTTSAAMTVRLRGYHTHTSAANMTGSALIVQCSGMDTF